MNFSSHTHSLEYNFETLEILSAAQSRDRDRVMMILRLVSIQMSFPSSNILWMIKSKMDIYNQSCSIRNQHTSPSNTSHRSGLVLDLCIWTRTMVEVLVEIVYWKGHRW